MDILRIGLYIPGVGGTGVSEKSLPMSNALVELVGQECGGILLGGGVCGGWGGGGSRMRCLNKVRHRHLTTWHS